MILVCRCNCLKENEKTRVGYDSSPRLAKLAHVETRAIRHHPLFLNTWQDVMCALTRVI